MPSKYWRAAWWAVPISAILLLPLGTAFFQLLSAWRVPEAPRWLQLSWVFALLYGLLGGVLVLLLVGQAGLPSRDINKVKWLARIAVISPFLELSVLFWIFSNKP
jgi:hypothetical protein